MEWSSKDLHFEMLSAAYRACLPDDFGWSHAVT